MPTAGYAVARLRRVAHNIRSSQSFYRVYSSRVWRRFTERLDRWAIAQACSSVLTKHGDHHEREAEQLLAEQDFFSDPVEPPQHIAFQNGRDFSFKSQRQTRWPSNSIVHGRLFR